MKRKIVVVLFAVMLAFSGCSKGETSQPEKEPEKNESVKDDAEEELENGTDKIEQKLGVYYIDETTGEITRDEVTVAGELQEVIVAKLKEASVLSETCEVQSVSVNDSEEKIDLDVNTAFGDYLRGMGTTGSEQVLECVVRTYSEAYDCDGVKITEKGNPLDTGHAVLEGYISYE